MRVLSRRALGGLLLASAAGCKGRAAEGAAAQTASAPRPAGPPAPPEPAAPSGPPLLRAYPAMAERLPWVTLGRLPTPIERAERLGRGLGVEALYVKRDDLSGEVYGGGKTRKLELLLAEARQRGARGVVTLGGVGSNQAVATALYGAALGLPVTLLLAPQRPGALVRANLLAARRAGAAVRLASRGVAAAEAEALAEARSGGPYVIPPGGSSPLGNLAFVNAGLELAEQVAAGQMPEPDLVYMAMGTMGSAVGVALGLAAAGLATEVVAVRASSPATSSEARLAAMERATMAHAQSLDPSFPQARGRVRIVGGQLGPGYGLPTAAGLRAVALADELAGWALEPTYTGKALAALAAEAPALGGKVVLFWNSHSSRPLRTDGVGERDFPEAMRRYVG